MTSIQPLGDWIDAAPWRDRAVSVIDFDAGVQAHGIGEKRDLLASAAGRTLHVAWTGRYRTDVRAMTAAEALSALERV